MSERRQYLSSKELLRLAKAGLSPSDEPDDEPSDEPDMVDGEVDASPDARPYDPADALSYEPAKRRSRVPAPGREYKPAAARSYEPAERRSRVPAPGREYTPEDARSYEPAEGLDSEPSEGLIYDPAEARSYGSAEVDDDAEIAALEVPPPPPPPPMRMSPTRPSGSPSPPPGVLVDAPPPPVRRSPTRPSGNLPPPPPPPSERAKSSPRSGTPKRKRSNWLKVIPVMVLLGIFFSNFNSDDPEPVDQALFREEFNGELAAGWTWENEVPDRWTIEGGSLHLDPPPQTSSNWEPANNVLLRSPGASTYTVVTRSFFAPSSNFQAAGITVYEDEGNSIQLVHAFCDDELPSCVGEGIYFDNIVDGAVPENQGGRARASDRIFLRIDLIGNAYTGWYSLDGVAWTTAGTIRRDFTSPRVGIVARGNDPQPPVSSFEFFLIFPSAGSSADNA